MLANYQIVFVKSLRTVFYFTPSKTDITKTSEGTTAFIDEKKRRIYILAELPRYLPVEQVLSREISKILKIPFALPLEPIITCSPSEIKQKVQLLQMSNDMTGKNQVSRPFFAYMVA